MIPAKKKMTHLSRNPNNFSLPSLSPYRSFRSSKVATTSLKDRMEISRVQRCTHHLTFLLFTSDHRYERIQYECIRCLRAIMNNAVGLTQIFGQKEALPIIARSLEPLKPSVMLETVKVLAAVCLIPPNGHEKALEAITMSGEFNNTERFKPIIQGLMITGNEPLRVGTSVFCFFFIFTILQRDLSVLFFFDLFLQTACLQLINAIVETPDDLEFRIHLRNEIMRTGLYDILDVSFWRGFSRFFYRKWVFSKLPSG